MFSTTKGVASLALAHAHSRGLLDYDERVAAYWLEFAWRGKDRITVRQLLSHQAGLPVIDVPLTIADLADLDLVAAAIALQKPLWPAGTRHGYHGSVSGGTKANQSAESTTTTVRSAPTSLRRSPVRSVWTSGSASRPISTSTDEPRW